MVAVEQMPRPKGKTPPRVALSARVAPDVLKDLEVIADETSQERRIPVTVSQLVELAVVEFVERHRKQKQK